MLLAGLARPLAQGCWLWPSKQGPGCPDDPAFCRPSQQEELTKGFTGMFHRHVSPAYFTLTVFSSPLASNTNTKGLAQVRWFCSHGRCEVCMDCVGVAPIMGDRVWNSRSMAPTFSILIFCYLMVRPRTRFCYWAVLQTFEKKSRSFTSSKGSMEMLKWVQWQENKSLHWICKWNHHFLCLSLQFWPSARGKHNCCL